MRTLYTLGYLFLLVGLLLNEWTVPYLLNIDPLGLKSRAFLWIADFVAISWGLLTIRYFEKEIIRNVNLLLVTFILLIGIVEATLRIHPSILGRPFMNSISTKYTTAPGGIYYLDPVLNINFMYPNFRTDMYYNDYHWVHQTDQFGFRSEGAITRADIVLLGDSFIYGHGVNIDATVGHFIQRFTGCSVMNMARQGDYSYPEAYLLTEYIDRFSPRYVLYFYYENDLSELRSHLSDDEINQFINTPVNQIKNKPRMDMDAAIKMTRERYQREIRKGSLTRYLRRNSYIVRGVDCVFFVQRLGKRFRLSQRGTHDINDEETPEWQYTLHSISYMNYIAKLHDARFIIVPITPDNERHQEILHEFARKNDIAFIETKAINRSDKSLWLPGDGHFSEKGAQTIAHLVADELSTKNCQLVR